MSNVKMSKKKSATCCIFFSTFFFRHFYFRPKQGKPFIHCKRSEKQHNMSSLKHFMIDSDIFEQFQRPSYLRCNLYDYLMFVFSISLLQFQPQESKLLHPQKMPTFSAHFYLDQIKSQMKCLIFFQNDELQLKLFLVINSI